MLTKEDIPALDWTKTDGLIPAIVQDATSGQVLMLGCMNEEALAKTLETGKVTFFLAPRDVYGPRAKRATIGSISLTSLRTAIVTRCSF